MHNNIKEYILTDLNASLILGYTGSDITSIIKTIDGVSYQKSLAYDGSGNLTNVSAWVEL